MTATSDRALIVADLQNSVVEGFGVEMAMLMRVNQAINAARASGALIVFVRLAFRASFPEANPANTRFYNLARSGQLTENDERAAIHPSLTRQPQDPVVTKRRVSAFASTDLQMMLRARAIARLTLCGATTSGVILSTLRAAADLDYRIDVLSDCVCDGDEEAHQFLLQKIFPKQASVIAARDWMGGLQTLPT